MLALLERTTEQCSYSYCEGQVSSSCTLRLGAAATAASAPPTLIRALPAQVTVRELERVSLIAHVAAAPGVTPDARWFAADSALADSSDFSVCSLRHSLVISVLRVSLSSCVSCTALHLASLQMSVEPLADATTAQGAQVWSCALTIREALPEDSGLYRLRMQLQGSSAPAPALSCETSCQLTVQGTSQ